MASPTVRYRAARISAFPPTTDASARRRLAAGLTAFTFAPYAPFCVGRAWRRRNPRTSRGLVDMLEQALARQLMAATNQTGEPAVIDGDLLFRPTLAAKTKQQPPVANELHVAIAQRREAVTVVVARIFGIADADTRDVKKTHDDRQHLFPWQAFLCEIATQAS